MVCSQGGSADVTCTLLRPAAVFCSSVALRHLQFLRSHAESHLCASSSGSHASCACVQGGDGPSKEEEQRAERERAENEVLHSDEIQHLSMS